MDEHLAAVGGLKTGGHVEAILHSGCLAGATGIHLQDVSNEAVVAAMEQAIHVEHAGERADGVGAAAESEEIDAVAFFIDIHKKAIGVADVAEQARAEAEPSDNIEEGFQLIVRGG